MAKVLCVLYPDPVGGFPPVYARKDIPVITHYPDGTTTPTLKAGSIRRGDARDSGLLV